MKAEKNGFTDAWKPTQFTLQVRKKVFAGFYHWKFCRRVVDERPLQSVD
jgi:hypothetical protein